MLLTVLKYQGSLQNVLLSFKLSLSPTASLYMYAVGAMRPPAVSFVRKGWFPSDFLTDEGQCI